MPIFALDGSRIRNTTFSPHKVGKVFTRKSMALLLESFILMRPSCGTRRSEISICDITFNRAAILPLLKRGNRLFIAQSDPSNITAIDEIKFNTGMNVEPVLVEENKLAVLVEKFMASEETAFDDFGDEDLDVDIENPEEAQKTDEPGTGDDAPIVRFVNKMLLDAIKAGSSDLHFEPYEKRYRVRCRTDGVLQLLKNGKGWLCRKACLSWKNLKECELGRVWV